MQRRDFLVAALGVPFAAAARAQTPPHWLVGTWLGEVRIPQEKNGTARRMVVLSVKGSDVALRYGFPETAKPPIVHGTLNGEELRFNTPGERIGDNAVVVTRSGADELAGTWANARSGRTYPISFKRQKAP